MRKPNLSRPLALIALRPGELVPRQARRARVMVNGGPACRRGSAGTSTSSTSARLLTANETRIQVMLLPRPGFARGPFDGLVPLDGTLDCRTAGLPRRPRTHRGPSSSPGTQPSEQPRQPGEPGGSSDTSRPELDVTLSKSGYK